MNLDFKYNGRLFVQHGVKGAMPGIAPAPCSLSSGPAGPYDRSLGCGGLGRCRHRPLDPHAVQTTFRYI
jgi:hypothetical protein